MLRKYVRGGARISSAYARANFIKSHDNVTVRRLCSSERRCAALKRGVQERDAREMAAQSVRVRGEVRVSSLRR